MSAPGETMHDPATADDGQAAGAADPGPAAQQFDLPGFGPCILPAEFAVHTGPLSRIEAHDARESPPVLLELAASGAAVVLTGDYEYADAVFRYCQRYQRRMADPVEIPDLEDVPHRNAAFTALRRMKLHRILVLARGDALLGLVKRPDTSGLQAWLDEPTGDAAFLLPVRRLQRILTDMRRARDGLEVKELPRPITILPRVYVPTDLSVPRMFTRYRHLLAGHRVLDMGTGTGILALLAGQMGAARVVAVDVNPSAVANARINAERLGMSGVVDVRPAAYLFDAVKNEMFDVIMFNAPWIKGEPRTPYDAANYDPEYRVIRGFLAGVRAHLVRGGVVLLQYSDISQRQGDRGIDHLHAMLAEAGLRIASTQTISRRSRVLGGNERVHVFELR